MSAQALIPPAFLALSCVSLGVQVWALAHLIGNGHNLIDTGLLRTSICRVACAVLYVYVGLNALWFTWAELYIPLVVFGVVQATWQANAVADVQLKRKLTQAKESTVAYAPQAIQQLYAAIQARIPSAQCSGIVGDAAHSFGYHLARNELPAADYSVALPLDLQGDPSAASALDITLDPALMVTVTNRLLNAARAGDPRLKAVREFCGTTDGNTTHPYDLSSGQDGPLDSWDSSHLWHVHLSFYRAYSNDYAAIAAVADVITGVSAAAPDALKPKPLTVEDEMYTLWQVVVGPGRGQVWAVRPGEAFWASGWEPGHDLYNLQSFGLIANPKPKDWKGTQLIQLQWLAGTFKKEKAS